MTTEQKFFTNIVHSNAITFEVIDKLIGDMNKNIGISAEFYESASKIVGSSATENYDLASLFGFYESNVQSNDADALRQSLQNAYIGVTNTFNYPLFDVCAHISTSLNNYSINTSSAFLSGQIYSVSSTGLGTSSVVSIPINSINVQGSQYKSHLFDVPVDFAVYGNNNFTGNYTGSDLVKFDYAWSYAHNSTNLLIKFNYSSPLPDYYFTLYWGSTNFNNISISTSLNGNIKYVGTSDFVNNIGVLTSQVAIPTGLADYSGRKNFWSNKIPYAVDFAKDSFIEQDAYLWADDRINSQLTDGVKSTAEQPLRYPAYTQVDLDNYLYGGKKYIYAYTNFLTSGSEFDPSQTALLRMNQLAATDYLYKYDPYLSQYLDRLNPAGNFIVAQKNPKKINLSNEYTVIQDNQIIPSAFTKNIADVLLWNSFADTIYLGKDFNLALDQEKVDFLNTLDNFIATFFFGVNFNNVNDYFVGDNLIVSRNVLKTFTQPNGDPYVPPVNFSEYEEKSIFGATNIVASKEFLIFDKGRLELINDYPLPVDVGFEIYKPISFVCNGIDPYQQGNSLALDYTLNLKFRYQNQNILNKVLYLMASKYLISKSDYENRIFDNLPTTGYYYLADPQSKDYNDYSVSSINEFRLYGYAGLIPDLKDTTTRPILTKSFSPVDDTKYTREEFIQLLISQGITDPDDINDAIQEYLDAGNSFYIVDLSKFPSEFVALEDVSICATNYVINQTPYWDTFNEKVLLQPSLESESGFTELFAQINSGLVTSVTSSPPYVIPNIPVGSNNVVDSVTINSFGALQVPGTYTNWILPDASVLTDEQPAQIKFQILDSGAINPSSIEILNKGGNFYFGFSTFLNSPLQAGVGATNALITLNMDNISLFEANVDSNYNLISMTQTNPPAKGYLYGFKLNPKAFVGLGYTSFADVDITVNQYITSDSFIIGTANLQPGDLENYASFNATNSNLADLNYTTGTQQLYLYDSEVLNKINIPSGYAGSKISFITLKCKLIEINGRNPSGFIKLNIYVGDETKVLLASSDEIPVSEIPREKYTDLNIPIDFQLNPLIAQEYESIYWISVQQNLQNSLLAITGDYVGISTSDFTIENSLIFNDPSSASVVGVVTSAGYDLDLGKFGFTINNIVASNSIASTTKTLPVSLRKDTSYNGANQVALSISTSYNLTTAIIVSNFIDVSSLSPNFVETTFSFDTDLEAGTVINSASFIGISNITPGQIYIPRSLDPYTSSGIGLATSSQIGLSNTYLGFNFVFNKIFNQVNPDIYGGFNYFDRSQFGLANPNTLRRSGNSVVVDGYWSYKSSQINNPVSVYPRALFSNTSVIGTSQFEYAYIGYTHDIYLNIGFNSGNEYNEESILLSAYPKWKTTWLGRDAFNYKNFDIFNVLQQTYSDSIDYQLGFANTIIGVGTGPKSGIFVGTFKPSGSLALTVPVAVTIGTGAGVQLFVNGSNQPRIDSFATISTDITTYTTVLSVEERSKPVLFELNYFTLSTAVIDIKWNVGSGNTLVNYISSLNSTSATPVAINGGLPIDNIVFMNISKTESEAESINGGYPTGDSFIIRSS